MLNGRLSARIAGILLVAVLIAPNRLVASTGASGGADAAEPGKVVVAVRQGTTLTELQALAARQGYAVERWLPSLGLGLLAVPPGREALSAAALSFEPGVLFTGEHRRSVRSADAPLDEHWDQQWGPVKVEAPGAWDLAWGDPLGIIAIVDSGVLQTHVDLRDRTWYNPGESAMDPATGKRTCNTPLAADGKDNDGNGYVDDCRGWDFVQSDNNPADQYGHGTVVAGIAAASVNNPKPAAPGTFEGVAGMDRAARLMAVRTLDSAGYGFAFDVAAAIDYAVQAGASVVNLSLTLPVANPYPSDVAVLRTAVNSALAHAVIVVGAAGNDSYNGVAYPAAFPGVLAVGASTAADQRAPFSNFGARLDLVAPGSGIYSTLVAPGTNSYGLYRPASQFPGSGTSFSAPLVAGVASLVRTMRPDFSPEQVHALLRATAADVDPPGFDNQTGWGRLNARRALEGALEALTLSIEAVPPGVAPGGHTALLVRVQGPGGVAAGAGARVSLTALNGLVSPAIVTVGADGMAQARFSPTGSSNLSVTASLGQLGDSVPITLTSGLPSVVGLAADPVAVPAGGAQTTVTATVVDEAGSFVADGLGVSFATDLGALAPASATTVDGRAAVVLTSSAEGGVATVTAVASGHQGQLQVAFLGIGQPFELTLAAQPSEIQITGQPATLAATVRDPFGALVPDGTLVEFATTLGTLTPATATTQGGVASVELSPGMTPGIAAVTAKAGLASASRDVTILPGPTHALVLTAEPSQLTVGFGQSARLRASATDLYGNAVAEGVMLSFETTLGTLAQQAAGTADGVAETDLLAGLVAGKATVTVSAPGGATASTQVVIRPGPASTMTLSSVPVEITVGGAVTHVTVTVRDLHGNGVADGTAVNFSTDLGQFRNGKGEPVGPLFSAATNGGVAGVDLISGSAAGLANVQAATVNPPLMTQGMSIPFRAGPPVSITLGIDPEVVETGGRVELNAWVTDQFGNPVSNGTPVTFAANRGTIEASPLLTEGGSAVGWLRARALPGPIQIVAVSGTASAFGSVSVTPAVYSLPLGMAGAR